ncbi:hypothetical protein PCE1_002046 [Barthelona sp. PCE]
MVWFFITDDGFVVLGHHYGNCIYDGHTGKMTKETETYCFEEETYGFCVSSTLNGGYMCAAGMCGELLVVKVSLSEEDNRFSISFEEIFNDDMLAEEGFTSVHLSADDKTVFALTDDNTIYIQSIETGVGLVRDYNRPQQ